LAAVHEYLLAEADLFDLTSPPDGKLLPSTSSIGTTQWLGALEHVGQAFGLTDVTVEELLSSSDETQPHHVVRLSLTWACTGTPREWEFGWREVHWGVRCAVAVS
jgi:hypothetical protein